MYNLSDVQFDVHINIWTIARTLNAFANQNLVIANQKPRHRSG